MMGISPDDPSVEYVVEAQSGPGGLQWVLCFYFTVQVHLLLNHTGRNYFGYDMQGLTLEGRPMIWILRSIQRCKWSTHRWVLTHVLPMPESPSIVRQIGSSKCSSRQYRILPCRCRYFRICRYQFVCWDWWWHLQSGQYLLMLMPIIMKIWLPV